MDTKLFARIAAGAFVAVALITTVLTLREERGTPLPAAAAAREPAGDPLSAPLRACAAMGELALSSPVCRTAWAEQRRRFLGIGPAEPRPAAEAQPPHPDHPPVQGQ